MSESINLASGESARRIGVRSVAGGPTHFWAHMEASWIGTRYRTPMGEFEYVDLGPASRWADDGMPPPG